MSSPQPLPEDAVLAGFDGSDNSRRAVLWAAAEAVACDAALVIVQSFERSVTVLGDDHQRLREHAAEQVATMAAECQRSHPALTVVTRVPDGRPDDTIPELVAESSPRLLVLGASGLGAVSRVVLGSTAGALVRTVRIPIVVVRGERTEPGGAPVVAGLDGTAAGDRAVEFALDFAARHDAPLRVIHAVSGPAHLPSGSPAVPAFRTEPLVEEQDATKPTEDAVALRVDRLRERQPGLPVDTEVVVGRPAEALMDQAENAQLLVVGTHGRGVVDRIILGSTSHAALYHAPCPLALVHP